MPFTEAVILETLRYSSLAPQGVIHKLLKDTRFKEYLLPKGTLIIPNLYGIHHDPKVWSDPDIFRPERFLETTNSNFRENLIPFQVGRRACLGELLAKDLVFLFTVKIFLKFDISLDPQIPVEQYKHIDIGLILVPKELNVMIKPKLEKHLH